MSDFEAWLSNLEREVERLPVLHGDHAGVKAELRRLVAYARGRAGAPPPASEPEPAPEPAAPEPPATKPEPEPATEPEPAPAPSEPADEQPQ
jgi:outer membrane biosynthesis protein TonB